MLYRDRLGAIHEAALVAGAQLLSYALIQARPGTASACAAASRAFLTIAKLAAIEQYLYEKSRRRRCHRADSAAWCE